MPHKQGEATIVRTFWKMFARDPSCPWALRVYCVNNLALSAQMFKEMPPIPGTSKVKVPESVTDPSTTVSKNAPTEAEAAAAVAVADVKNFMSQLNGTTKDLPAA